MPVTTTYNYAGQYTNMCYLLPCGKQMNGTNGHKKSFVKLFQLHQRYCYKCLSLGPNALNQPPSYHYAATKHSATPISYISSNLNK